MGERAALCEGVEEWLIHNVECIIRKRNGERLWRSPLMFMMRMCGLE